MRVLVDGKVRELPAGAATLADALRELVGDLQKAGRWVTKLTLDGTDATSTPRPQFENDACDRHLLLEVESQETGEFLRGLLANMQAFLRQLRTQHEVVSNDLRLGVYSAALQRSLPVLGGWRTFMQFLGDLVRASASLGDRLPMDAGRFRSRLQELQQTMEETRRAIDTQDVSLLTDLFAHDLPERLDAWETFLQGLAP